jgi:hypothetical protein
MATGPEFIGSLSLDSDTLALLQINRNNLIYLLEFISLGIQREDLFF